MSPITSDLRSWVAENIILGNDTLGLIEKLVGLGYSKEDAENEILEAQSHPYVFSGIKFHSQLKKREALLKTLDFQMRGSASYLKLEKVKLPPFSEFLENYYFPNRPGLFSGAIDSWEASKWTLESLVEKVGWESLVEIQQGRESDHGYEVNKEKFKRQIEFGRFINMVQSVESSNDFYLTANNAAFANSNMKCLIEDIGNIGDGYLKAIGEGTHLWIGPRGTITPLHHDLTNNLFIQIYGSKRYRLIPAIQVPYIYNFNHVFSEVDLLHPDYDKYPNYKKITPIDFEINAGEMLFIPIGYWHHVVSLSPNISLTLTNFKLNYNGFVEY